MFLHNEELWPRDVLRLKYDGLEVLNKMNTELVLDLLQQIKSPEEEAGFCSIIAPGEGNRFDQIQKLDNQTLVLSQKGES